MLFFVEQQSGTPIALQIYVAIVYRVLRGQHHAGERLVTIDALVESLGVAHATVAESYKMLQTRGVIETKRRGGSTIAKISEKFRRTLEDEEYERFLLTTARPIWLSIGMSSASVSRYHNRHKAKGTSSMQRAVKTGK